MNRIRMGAGTKLFLTFSSMFALILLLVFTYEALSRQSSRLLDGYSRKLEIGSQIELATTEMQGAQRGLTLSWAMHDPTSAAPYVKLYADSARKIDTLYAELQPLLKTDAERAAAATIIQNLHTWAPRFEELRRLCESGDIPAAYNFRNANKLISAAMHAGATNLVAEEKSARDQATAEFRQRSSLISTAVLLLCGLLGTAGVVVVRKTTGHLHQSSRYIHESADRFMEAARLISNSTRQVADGALNQAASIEQTSAASREMTGTSLRNAENAQQAVELSRELADRVTRATTTLDQMTASMREISESGSAISKIIKVINEIAFQTNLLALNASVEAARAGSAGAGFAVVADEVRNLAQRSAQSARDTAVLIETSIAKSHDGGRRLDEVAMSIREITEGANKVRELVDLLGASGRQQAQGAQEISGSVVRIDQITQRTAENARESAAATNALTKEAQGLLTVVLGLQSLLGSADQRIELTHLQFVEHVR